MKISALIRAASIALLTWGVVGTAAAQIRPSDYDFTRPTLDWYTIQTEHFNIIFHADEDGRGSSRTAQVVARIAEDVFDPITSLYDHRPEGRVSIILKDFEDYSNGAAYFFDNKIEIWAPALDSPLRGDHNWLRNVITHEFTHIVQVQASMKSSRRIPFFYLQYLDYEDVRRPDVLYGYPNVIATYPFASINNPAWLAEGTAQYQREFLDYDRWDSHRDMLLRTRMLAGEALSLNDMGGFYSHNSLERELVYNHGFAFTTYLAGRFGEDVLRDVTSALARWPTWTVQRAIRHATGVSGNQVHRDWVDELTTSYADALDGLGASHVDGDLIEGEGFNNFYPAFSPDGSRLAYVSNRGEDFSSSSLYVRDLATGTVTSHLLEDGAGPAVDEHVCALGHRLRRGVGGRVGWHPDGNRIVFGRTRTTPEGYRFADLYELDLDSGKTNRLTRRARALTPSFSPDGRLIAFSTLEDGSSNIAILDVESARWRAVTRFDDGRQATDPAWHPSGEWIYFALSGQHGRDVYRVHVDGEAEPEPVVTGEDDIRFPTLDPAGRFLYFSSDRNGIHNIYRVDVEGASAVTPITHVTGGAYMPSVRWDGAVAYAVYGWDGYKIAMLDQPNQTRDAPLPAYQPPELLRPKVGEGIVASGSFAYDDSDVRPVTASVISSIRSVDGYELTSTGSRDTEEPAAGLSVSPYSDVFTTFSVMPVVRLDRYVDRKRARLDARIPDRGRGETLLRNTKVGAYVQSREVLEEMSLLGGLLVSPFSRDYGSASGFFAPSRLLNLERDMFLEFTYGKGFGFIPKRWSPQLTVEVYNIRRNVESGLSVEEFPCTACYPDTTFADISYNLWEAGLYARSKASSALLLEAGYRYSPYRVTTERFFSREFDQFIDASSSRYFIGRAWRGAAYLEAERPHRHMDVVPEGIRMTLAYEYEMGRLLEDFQIEDGMLMPAYVRHAFHRITWDARLAGRLPGNPLGGSHGWLIRTRGSWIPDEPDDSFFYDYVGGLIGARGYPFYALGGSRTAWMQLSYQFPLIPKVGRQIGFTYVDKVYGRLYADAAAAWSGGWPGGDGIRRDVGAEIRASLGSFYLLPTAVFASATYGMDRFDVPLDDDFLTPDGRSSVTYGREWLWHFGVLFDFDL